jgi:hypothetical protein
LSFGDEAKWKKINDKPLAIKTAKADAAHLSKERDAKMVEKDGRREAEKEEENDCIANEHLRVTKRQGITGSAPRRGKGAIGVGGSMNY